MAKNSAHLRVEETPQPMIYDSILQSGDPETILQARTLGRPEGAAPAVVEAIHQINPQWLVYDVRPLRETAQAANTFAMMESTFASAFALLALVLAASGIYGVLAYRTQLICRRPMLLSRVLASRQPATCLPMGEGCAARSWHAWRQRFPGAVYQRSWASDRHFIHKHDSEPNHRRAYAGFLSMGERQDFQRVSWGQQHILIVGRGFSASS